MTRKDYVLIAQAFQAAHHLVENTPSGNAWVDAERSVAIDATAKLLADRLKVDNAAFDRERFLAAASAA